LRRAARDSGLAGALSLIWVFLLYGSALSNPFVYDDVPQILENHNVRSVAAATKYFRESVAFSPDYTPYSGSFYRPLFWLSLGLDGQMWGSDSPIGFHLTNIFLHYLNAALFFLLLRRLGLSFPLTYLVPLIWLSLPVNTEVVAWVSGRAFSLATAFMLCGLLALDSHSRTGRWYQLAILSAASLCATLSHEVGIVLLPLGFLLLLYCGRLRGDGGGRTAAAGISLALSVMVYLALRAHAEAHLPAPTVAHAAAAALQAPVAFVKYLYLTVYPPALSMERSTELSELQYASTLYALSWVAVGGAVVALIKTWHRLPLASLGLAWAMVSLSPFLNVIPLYQAFAERYAYLASMGLVLTLMLILDHSVRRLRRHHLLGITALAVWFGWAAWRVNARVAEWGDEWSLYTSSLSASPRSHVLHYNLGVKHAEAGRTDRAEHFYRRAVELKAEYPAAKVNLANLLQRKSQYAEAERLYEEVLAVEPQRQEAMLNLANLRTRNREYESAETLYRKVLALNPRATEAAVNLATLYQLVGRHAEARDLYREAIGIDPNQGQAHLNLGALLYQQGLFTEAENHLRRATELLPASAQAAYNLGLLYDERGRTEEARAWYQRALQLDPGHEKAAGNLRLLERP
jgi:protein O-mannosyl-transferase